MILILACGSGGTNRAPRNGRDNRAVSGAHGHGSSGHGHAREHAPGAGSERSASRSVTRLTAAFALTVAFVAVEAVTALLAGSLALLSDAGHMLTDGAAIGLALGAIVVANRASTAGSRTFGLFRLEIIASLANALLLFAVAGYVMVEGVLRLVEGSSDVDVAPVLVVAVGGLAVNAVVFVALRQGARGSLAVKSAALEALADAVGSVGVMVAAIVVAVTGWEEADAVVAIAISVWIVPRAWHLARSALRVLLQVAPEGVDLDAIRHELGALPDVVDVHDLHVWTLTSEMDVASAHVMVSAQADTHAVLDGARALLESHHIAHATIQVEPDDHEGCAELNW
jgi:cobalt-zinc-cadmium efflux system protein